MKWPWSKPKPEDPLAARVRELLATTTKPELARAVVAFTREMAAMVDALTLQTVSTAGANANPYITRATRVAALVLAYDGKAEWGNGLVKRLVNIRRAYQMPHGLHAVLADGYEEAADELDHINEVLDDNNLNEGKAQEAVKQRELEGQLLVQLRWIDATGKTVLRVRPWREMNYTVELVDKADPNGPKRAKFTKNGAVVETLEDDEFAYVSFSGSGDKLEGNPEVGDAIWHCENADKLLFAWRKFNNLFASLTAHFKCADQATADKIEAMIKAAGWKIGMALATSAEMSLVGPSDGPGDLFKLELYAIIQTICGLTGVEPQDIGFPDVLSNRAVATEMGEPQELATEADMTLWRGFFEDLFAKIIRLRNSKLFGQLDENAVIADIKLPTARQWARVKDIFLPAFAAGGIDRETLVRSIPELDVEAVLARLEGDDERKAKNQMAAFGLNAMNAIGE